MPFKRKEEPDYLAPYRIAVDAFGPSFEATLWANPDMQAARFDVFLGMAPFADAVIVDAGAGQGALAQHLAERNISFAAYIALEAMHEMNDSGKALNIPNTQFHTVDFAADIDVFSRLAGQTHNEKQGIDIICFSGSLNTFEQDAACEILDRAWQSCSRALLFNFLSARTTKPDTRDLGDPARRFDPLEMLDWALERTPAVSYRQDYFPQGHDATIALLKEG